MRGNPVNAEERHPSTQQIARFFTFDHLADGLQPPSAACAELAQQMIDRLPDGPELTAGLRKLLEAKDCFVRAAVSAHDGE
jgi:hypothetical protein